MFPLCEDVSYSEALPEGGLWRGEVLVPQADHRGGQPLERWDRGSGPRTHDLPLHHHNRDGGGSSVRQIASGQSSQTLQVISLLPSLSADIQHVLHIQRVQLCLNCDKISVLLGSLDFHPPKPQKTLIITNSAEETEHVYKVRNSTNHSEG